MLVWKLVTIPVDKVHILSLISKKEHTYKKDTLQKIKEWQNGIGFIQFNLQNADEQKRQGPQYIGFILPA